MSYALIRAQVKTVLEGVTGIGKVYAYVRRPQTTTTRDSLFVTSGGKFHVWFVTRTAMEASALMGEGVEREHVVRLIGYYEIDDANASETTFQDLCDTIMNTFDDGTNVQLNNTGDQLNAAQLIEFSLGGVEFNGVICHQAVIEIRPNEIVEV